MHLVFSLKLSFTFDSEFFTICNIFQFYEALKSFSEGRDLGYNQFIWDISVIRIIYLYLSRISFSSEQ